MFGIAKKLFGTENDRKLKKLAPLVAKINGLEPEFEPLADDILKAKTTEFKARFEEGESLDDLLPEAFAVVREAAKRTLGQRHYDVQLMGGITLHRGEIAEMRTGEGKTLVATLAVYLNALSDRGVHVVTVNDYLAKRDAEWMAQVYRFLGLSVGVIVAGLSDQERKEAYNCDITYGTNNEFGFDYLRDNMKYSVEAMAQRGHAYAVIDEIDSILIDEARTPLIISGPTDDKSELYRKVDTIIPSISEEGFEVDEKARSATFTEAGNEQIETILRDLDMLEGESLYDVENVTIVHHINQALKAHKLYTADKDYIVKDDQVVLIDEFTGRMMDGRRLSEGLHQAIEAKENVDIKPENVTMASVTFQNYFRLYDKLSGMTGTALTEASEFYDIYKLNVLDIPTNRPIQRIDEPDIIFRSEEDKYKAIVTEIREAHKNGQPVLVGTVSIEKSEQLAARLTVEGIPHRVLNARYHEEEASIVAQAGVPGAITIATNMAGRGTDIQLGGNLEMRLEQEITADMDDVTVRRMREKITDEVNDLKAQALAAGGLYVLGTERHESRRIDNQLRGRTGRQGDPGRSKFYLSAEDDLMRIFGGDRMKNMMQSRFVGLNEGDSIELKYMSKVVERAQKRIETRNFDIRKNLLKFDDVMNDQRKTIFDQRLEFMTDDDVSDVIEDMRHDVCDDLIDAHIPKKAYPEQWDTAGLHEAVKEKLRMDLPVAEWAQEEGIAEEEMQERLTQAADAVWTQKTANLDPAALGGFQKQILLQTIDQNWQTHLAQLDHLKSVIWQRGVGQRDPLNEYKSESFTLFQKMLSELREGVTSLLMRLQFEQKPAEAPAPPQFDPGAFGNFNPAVFAGGGVSGAAPRSPQDLLNSPSQPAAPSESNAENIEIDFNAVPRNSPCPCGSGEKFKHCHGRLT